MKIQPKHYKELKIIIKKAESKNPKMKNYYKNLGLSKNKYAWDIFFKSQATAFCQKVLYKYLDDSHIETALLKIIR